LFGKFALIGKSIKHSKSEETYKKILKTDFISYTHLDYDNDSDIPGLDLLFKEFNFISITAPYKESIYSKVDSLERCSIEYSSVNAIKREGGKIIGTNTDLKAIEEVLKKYQNLGITNIILLGDGAMAKLVININKKIKSFKIEQLSRSKKNLDSLDQLLGENKLIINTCSREYKLKLEPKAMTYVWDFNYSQEYEKNLVGNDFIKYENGLDLLTLQAKYALSFWNLKKF